MNTHVLLVNRYMTIVTGPQRIQTFDGVFLGISAFDKAHSCHTLKLPLDVYEKHAKGLMDAAHLAMRKWEAHFVAGEVPEPVRQFWDGYNAGMDSGNQQFSEDVNWSAGYVAALKPEPMFEEEETAPQEKIDDSIRYEGENLRVGIERVGQEEKMKLEGQAIGGVDTLTITQTTTVCANDLDGKPFFSLKKIAKDEGVDISECEDNAAIKLAILTNRAKKA